MTNYEPIITSCIREMQAMAFVISTISIIFAIALYLFTRNVYISVVLPFIVNAALLMILTNKIHKSMCKKFHVE
nr:MAG TPA: hypothetical protein [Caudoviricetes sp.]